MPTSAMRATSWIVCSIPLHLLIVNYHAVFYTCTEYIFQFQHTLSIIANDFAREAGDGKWEFLESVPNNFTSHHHDMVSIAYLCVSVKGSD
jgi:hypothetical protein